MSGRVFILIGSLAASISVLAGAFGAHSLAEVLDTRAGVYDTAARYHMYHSLAIILVGLLYRRHRGRMLWIAGWLFVAGVLLFSGSLYILAISGVTSWGAIAPVGGAMFVLAWVMVGVSVWRAPHATRSAISNSS